MPRLRSVRARIIVTFSLLMLLLVGISLIPVFFRPQTAQVNVDADAVKKASATAAALADIDTELTLQLEVLRIFPVTKDWSFADTYRSSVARVEASVQEAKDLQGDSADPQTLATLDDITRRANSIGLAGDAVFVFTDVSDTEQATETSSRIEGEVAELRPMVADLISEQQRQMDVALASTAGGGGGGAGLPLWALLGSAGLVLVVGVWLALALSRSILRPLAALQADAHSIARGETTTMAHISGPTEFESLAKNLNRMIVALLAKETAETGVSESETRYRQLAERMADLVFRVDIQKGLTYANPVWEKVTGFTLEDLASGPEIVGRLVHPEHWQSFIALCKGMLSGNMPEGPLALKCLRKDGQTIWLTFSFVPTYHEDGRLAAIEGIARDTTMLSHLVKEVRQRDDQLRLFISLSNAVATAIGFEEATDRALEAVLELLPRAEAGFLMAYNRHRDLLELHAVRGLDQKIMSKLVVKPGENLIGKAFETGEPDLYSSIKELTAPAGLGPESGNLLKQAAAESGLPQSIMCAPLGIGERPFGCLVLVAFSEGSFQTSDLDLLQAAAAQVALPLENAQLRAETDLKAITDGLTGLYNRAYFHQRLAEEMERSKRYEHSLAVIIADIENLKSYNEARGQEAGDKVLLLVADSIRSQMRRSDVACRYSDDEFAAILMHVDSARAQIVVKRMGKSLTKKLKDLNDPATADLSLSAGLASFPDDANTADDLVRLADISLYSSKLGDPKAAQKV